MDTPHQPPNRRPRSRLQPQFPPSRLRRPRKRRQWSRKRRPRLLVESRGPTGSSLNRRSTYAGVVDTGPVPGETKEQKIERLTKLAVAAKQRSDEGGAEPTAAVTVVDSSPAADAHRPAAEAQAETGAASAAPLSSRQPTLRQWPEPRVQRIWRRTRLRRPRRLRLRALTQPAANPIGLCSGDLPTQVSSIPDRYG